MLQALRALPTAVTLCVLLASRTASADVAPRVSPQAGTGDGVYGRFDGDVDWGVGVGARIDRTTPRLAVQSTLHYFSMAGVYAGYADSFSEDQPVSQGEAEQEGGPEQHTRAERDAGVERHLVLVGIDLRPAFVPRWALGMEVGPTWVDLTIDSISLGIGAYWSEVDGDFANGRGLETGLGFGFPLVGKAAGPWLDLRGSLMLADHPERRALATATISLSWHVLWKSPLARAAP